MQVNAPHACTWTIHGTRRAVQCSRRSGQRRQRRRWTNPVTEKYLTLDYRSNFCSVRLNQNETDSDGLRLRA